jgi:hypothetical protein
MDEQADGIENHFHDLPTTTKRRNRHVVPQGNGGVRIINLPDLHRQAGVMTTRISCHIYLPR